MRGYDGSSGNDPSQHTDGECMVNLLAIVLDPWSIHAAEVQLFS
jgi:hypothetical protein